MKAQIIIISTILIGLLLILGWVPAVYSVGDVVIAYKPYKKQPVEIRNPAIGGRRISFNEIVVSTDTDWAKSLSFELQNISNKNIIHLQVAVDFPLNDYPLTDSRRRNFRIPLTLGQNPKPGRPVSERQVVLAPNDTALIQVNENVLPIFEKQLAELGSGEALRKSSATILLAQVFFDDNTMWGGGTLFRWDSATKQWENSGRYDEIVSVRSDVSTNHFKHASFTDSSVMSKHQVLAEAGCVKNKVEDTFCGSCGQQVLILVGGGPGRDAASADYWTYLPCTNAQGQVDPSCGTLHWQSTSGECDLLE